jgi:hypothetical protein
MILVSYDLSAQQDSSQNERLPPYQVYYLGVNLGFATNTKRIDTDEPVRSTIANTPLAYIGLSCLIEGSYFFYQPRFRGEVRFDMPLGGSNPLSDGYRFLSLLGYSVFQTASWDIYPFLSLGLQHIKIQEQVTVHHYLTMVGVGADYKIPQSSFMVGLRNGYHHTFPLSSTSGFSNVLAKSAGGFSIQAFVAMRILSFAPDTGEIGK